ncbi:MULTISPECIES: alpha/beta hydrolase family protein [unclassified Clostridium]|uniref:alpha/beta hydrolase n=1 Tax=unclassified Clostridium TaxID=2614128 RepID=UPI0011068080|nr:MULTISPECIES: alpha/beta hydrolase family protein [unclassified Clostridium]
MALLHVNFFSDVLAISASMDVILPQKVSRQVGMGSAGSDKPLPVLYLLHGMSDDHTIWQRRTSIERYVAELPLIVVMPTTGRGAYTDMKHGYRYWTYISEELPQIVHEFFPQASWRREDTFAAGLSMGGYGAFKLGLRCPDKFAAVAALSGGLIRDSEHMLQNPVSQNDFAITFGTLEEYRGSDNDLLAVGERQLAAGVPLPRLFMCCGTEDAAYPPNVRFYEQFKDRMDITWFEEPGIHEWGFWDRNIQKVLDWLPIKGR